MEKDEFDSLVILAAAARFDGEKGLRTALGVTAYTNDADYIAAKKKWCEGALRHAQNQTDYRFQK